MDKRFLKIYASWNKKTTSPEDRVNLFMRSLKQILRRVYISLQGRCLFYICKENYVY